MLLPRVRVFGYHAVHGVSLLPGTRLVLIPGCDRGLDLPAGEDVEKLVDFIHDKYADFFTSK